MKPGARILIGSAMLTAVGCAPKVTGTWIADKTEGSKNPIASVTFCHDETFTAAADYGEKSRAESGCYSVDGQTLRLEVAGTTRRYGVHCAEEKLIITHEDEQATMTRLKAP